MADQRAYDSSWTHDAFLSFRGEDTRKNFTDHLYHALKQAGINVFRDDSKLRRGEAITSELEQAIQGTKIAVIVFSKNYASSSWCLEELVKIMECRRTLKQRVLPIFYDVDPSDVKKQTGGFGEAFAQRQQRSDLDVDKVLRWRMALTEAANLSGWDLRNTADGHEAKFITSIVENISRNLNRKHLFVPDNVVGIGPRVEAIISELDVGSGGVRMVGIWGMGGIGKTMVAKAVYNELYLNFQETCFLEDIKEISKQSNGRVRLQEQLLMAILKSRKIKLGSIDQGIILLQERLCHTKVLVILDGVDQMDQLNVLARSREWFGAGSRIIITTRDGHLLNQLKVDAIYTVHEMDDIEALELFSWHAFHKSYPAEDYYELSICVVNYCGGLPLALEVLGSFLFERTIPEWEDALNKLKTIPHDQIQRKLRISFDGLGDCTYQDIFLDVSCFFIGMDKNDVVQILDGCGFFAKVGISVLLQRSLLQIDKGNKLKMHDLLRDMGREIIREETPKELEKRSRLFLNDEVLDVLKKEKGTSAIEGLSLTLLKSTKKFLHTRAFIGMQKLRLLQLNYVRIIGNFGCLSRELRWLCWHGFPLKFLPKDFYMGKVVAMDLRYSKLKFFWKEYKCLEKLTILNRSHSHYLTHTPDFLKLPNLKRLQLKDCKSLVEVHSSIGSLKKLVFMNLKDCTGLKKLPISFFELRSLETLILSGCSKLESLPKDLGEMESLTTLIAEDVYIQQVPSTIVRLKKLKYLSLSRCKGPPSKLLASMLWSWMSPRKYLNSIVLPISLCGLESLTTLCLKSCNLLDDAIPKDIGSLVSLVKLDLQDNGFHGLPSSISGLSKLETLCLDNCTKLQQMPDVPHNLKFLFASNCMVLERTSDLSKIEYLIMLIVDDCPNLVEIPGLDKLLPFISHISMVGSCKMKQSFKGNILQGWMISGLSTINLPSCDISIKDTSAINCLNEIMYRGVKGDDFQDRFIFKSDGRSLFLKASQIIDFDLEGCIRCHYNSISVINYTKGVVTNDKALIVNDAIKSIEDQVWHAQLHNVEDCGTIHTIGDQCFDMSGWSRDRCAVTLDLYI